MISISPNTTSTTQGKKVIVGMSGGVDSSVSALLLQQQGYVVEGLFMKNWEEDDGTKYCTALQDLSDAQTICEQLGITLHKANFAAEYWDNVFQHFLDEYRSGRTPNPDVLCNKEIKFKAFLSYATLLGADFIATGHYCQKININGQSRLVKGADSNKDQSYFLHSVDKEKIAKTLFPVGGLTKTNVRQIAEQYKLATYNKKDSTGICFIGERRFKDFLQRYLPASPGAIETIHGEVIGQHSGLMYYTIGQRQGLCIGGLKNTTEEPWYVLDKNMKKNSLLVGQGKDNPLLFSTSLTCSHIDWVDGQEPNNVTKLSAKVRYRQQDQACSLMRGKNGQYIITFVHPQRAVTPGQSVVFYDGRICLGGGVIDTRNYSCLGS